MILWIWIQRLWWSPLLTYTKRSLSVRISHNFVAYETASFYMTKMFGCVSISFKKKNCFHSTLKNCLCLLWQRCLWYMFSIFNGKSLFSIVNQIMSGCHFHPSTSSNLISQHNCSPPHVISKKSQHLYIPRQSYMKKRCINFFGFRNKYWV